MMIDLNFYNEYRVVDSAVLDFYGSFGGSGDGLFLIPSPIDGQPLLVIASTGEGWDHISVSRAKRAPNQRELDHIYRLFFMADEVAMQLFVPKNEHINIHPHCLHLWRPQKESIPRPPQGFV